MGHYRALIWTKKTAHKFDVYTINEYGGSVTSIFQLLELYIHHRSLTVIMIFVLNRLGDLLDDFLWLNAKPPNLVTTYFRGLEAASESRACVPIR